MPRAARFRPVPERSAPVVPYTPVQKARNYPCTFFAKPDIDGIYGTGKVQYVVVGEEVCPKTEKIHWQSYIQLKLCAKTLVQMKKMFDKFSDKPAHWEPQWATDCEDAAKYCRKDGKFEERGTMKQQGTRNDLAAVKAMIDEEHLDEEAVRELVEYPLWCQYGRVFRDDIARHRPHRDWETHVEIHWGVTHSGKTHRAVADGGVLCSYVNGFWDQISEHMIIDDFDGRSIPADYMKKMLDRYAFWANVKNGKAPFNPKKITITSNIDPKEWPIWDEAIERRVSSVYHYGRPFVPSTGFPKPQYIEVP